VFFSPRAPAWRAAVQRGVRSLPAVAILAVLTACSRNPEPSLQRLAVLRFENLSPDSSTDWMGRAFSEVVAFELASAPAIYVIPPSRLHTLGPAFGVRPAAAPGLSAEAPLALAVGANRLAYGDYTVEHGRIVVRMVIEDLQARRLRVLRPVTVADPDVAAAATAVARQVWPQAPPYSAHNPAALEAYARAIEAPDAASSEQDARRAIADDPDFGSPYLLLADLQARQRNRSALSDTLRAAVARGAALAQIDRAHLETIAASLEGDLAARQRALDVLLRLTPNDPSTWRSAAELANQRNRCPESARAYEHALAIEPEDVASWNQLAYAHACTGNLSAAMAALRRYQALRPGDPNPLDSMGDVNLMAGRLQEAEDFYLKAARMSPSFLNGGDLYKAAFARLMSGDVPGADAIYSGYRFAQAHRAEWLWLSGRRREGYRMLAAQAPGISPRDAQAVAYAELAVWSMMLDDPAAASAAAQKAVQAVPPGSPAVAVAALARFLASPPLSPDAWEARARQFFPDSSGGASAGDLALGYAFLLTRQFQPAVAVLRRAYDASATSPEASTAAMLGRALAETGAWQEAASYLRLNPVPSPNGPAAFTALWFPSLFEARALAAEKLGRPGDARTDRALFEKLSH